MGERCAWPLVALLLASCSVGNLSFDEAMVELDSVAQLERDEQGRERIVYRERAELWPWHMRFWPILPLKPVLRWLFDTQPVPETLENPAERARDLMLVVGEEARGDMVRTAAVAQRLVRVVDLDTGALNRILAVQQLAAMLTALRLDVLAGVLDPERQPVAREGEAVWIDALRRDRPAARQGGRPPAGERRDSYLQALRELTRQPLSAPEQRLALLHDLQVAFAAETDPELRDATALALRRALHWCIQQALLAAMQGVEYEDSEVRRAAIAAVHRAAGPDGVPTILALIANPPDQVAAGNHRFDPDPFIRLRLIHMCGQLDESRARIARALPGRPWQTPTSPIDFLVQEILDPDPLYPGMRTLAIEALSHTLRRPVVYDDQWVRQWYADNHG